VGDLAGEAVRAARQRAVDDDGAAEAQLVDLQVDDVARSDTDA
jgi:hypothetical protein